MQPVFTEWNELTYRSKIYFSDLVLNIFWTHPMFSRVYGKIDHILNVTRHPALKKAHGIEIGDARRGVRGSTGLGDRGGSRKNLSSILYRPYESARPSLNFFRHLKCPFSKWLRTCIFLALSDPRVMPPDIP
jgi:hypothetical protein